MVTHDKNEISFLGWDSAVAESLNTGRNKVKELLEEIISSDEDTKAALSPIIRLAQDSGKIDGSIPNSSALASHSGLKQQEQRQLSHNVKAPNNSVRMKESIP